MVVPSAAPLRVPLAGNPSRATQRRKSVTEKKNSAEGKPKHQQGVIEVSDFSHAEGELMHICIGYDDDARPVGGGFPNGRTSALPPPRAVAIPAASRIATTTTVRRAVAALSAVLLRFSARAVAMLAASRIATTTTTTVRRAVAMPAANSSDVLILLLFFHFQAICVSDHWILGALIVFLQGPSCFVACSTKRLVE